MIYLVNIFCFLNFLFAQGTQQSVERWVAPVDESFILQLHSAWQLQEPSGVELLNIAKIDPESGSYSSVLVTKEDVGGSLSLESGVKASVKENSNIYPKLRRLPQKNLTNGIALDCVLLNDTNEECHFAYRQAIYKLTVTVPAAPIPFDEIYFMFGTAKPFTTSTNAPKTPSLGAPPNSSGTPTGEELLENKPRWLAARENAGFMLRLPVGAQPNAQSSGVFGFKAKGLTMDIARYATMESQSISDVEIEEFFNQQAGLKKAKAVTLNNGIKFWCLQVNPSQMDCYFAFKNTIYRAWSEMIPPLDTDKIYSVLGTLRAKDTDILAEQIRETETLLRSKRNTQERYRVAAGSVPAESKTWLELNGFLVAWLLFAAALIYGLMVYLADQSLSRKGSRWAQDEETQALSLFIGGKYLTLFPKVRIYAPGNVALSAYARRPPLLLVVAAVYAALNVLVLIFFNNPEESLTRLGVMVALALISLLSVGLWYLLWSVRGQRVYVQDESGQNVMTINRRLGLFAYRFVVRDSEGNPIGLLKMSWRSHLIRKHWWLLDSQNVLLAEVIEDSLWKSVLRRFLGHFWGILRAHFKIVRNHETIGWVRRQWSPFLRQKINCDPSDGVDGRLVLACAVAISLYDRDRWYPFWLA